MRSYTIDNTAPGRDLEPGSPIEQIRRAIHGTWGHVSTRERIVGDPEVRVYLHRVVEKIFEFHELNEDPKAYGRDHHVPPRRWMPFEAELIYFDSTSDIGEVTIVFSHHRHEPVIVTLKLKGV